MAPHHPTIFIAINSGFGARHLLRGDILPGAPFPFSS